MKINFEIPEDMCKTILDKAGYITEKAKLFYNIHDEYTGNEKDLMGVECTLAYPKNKRPKVLDKEKPLIEDCEEFIYGTAIEKLFNIWLINTMLQHNPWTDAHAPSY